MMKENWPFFGSLYAFPDLKERLILSKRALVGWERFALVGERTAIVWEVVHAVAEVLEVLFHFNEAADIAEISADLYLRTQD